MVSPQDQKRPPGKKWGPLEGFSVGLLLVYSLYMAIKHQLEVKKKKEK